MIVGLFVRGIKVYQNINFIPFLALGDECSIAKNKFISYIGANGSGKSSILEALDSFFNKKPYNINKNITASSYEQGKYPFIIPIFLIKKSDIKDVDMRNSFEDFSDYLWNDINVNIISNNPAKDEYKKFFELRDKLKHLNYQDNYYLLLLGECPTAGLKNPPIEFLSFIKDDLKKNEKFKDIFSNDERLQEKFKDILADIKELYSYVYLPVEVEAEGFTKLETDEMQKLIGKQLKNEIQDILKKAGIVDKINKPLNALLDNIKEILDNVYTYKSQSTKQNITKLDFTQKIIEAYFETKVLYKGNKRVSELSAGEKRQALIAVATAFLQKSDEIYKNIIVAVDEPENSLHASLCYEQFEKLHKISERAQILITTHWYGFLPIINYGYAHFLTKDSNDNKVSFESYSLNDYRSQFKRNPTQDFRLKSNYDLAQSIYYSLDLPQPYNWLLVEGITDKHYIETFLGNKVQGLNLKILPLGGRDIVKQMFELLKISLKELVGNKKLKGKVFCLIDTDNPMLKMDNDGELENLLHFRRLCHCEQKDKVALILIKADNTAKTDIEQCLNPEIFEITYNKLDLKKSYGEINIENKKGNTNFVKNLNNTKIDEFFKTNRQNKFDFCNKYIEIFEGKENKADFVPKWINEIEEFFIMKGCL